MSEEDEQGKPRTLLKPLDEAELAIYERLAQHYMDDPIRPFIPRFEGVVEDVDEKEQKGRFIRIGNLLQHFDEPKVMDVKLAVRTFAESESSGTKLRPDLYKRMAEMYPEVVTDAEHEAQGITKGRWMTVRDANSTIGALGYRIDGVAGYRRRKKKDLDLEFADYRTCDHTLPAFRNFVEVAATDDGEDNGGTRPRQIAEQFVEQLRCIRSALQSSDFFRRHEFIGTSLLLVADSHARTGVFWIDFAKTQEVPEGIEVTHQSPWVQGNHEDGMIIGLDNLIGVWVRAVESLQGMPDESSIPPLLPPLEVHEDEMTLQLGPAERSNSRQKEESSAGTSVRGASAGFLPRAANRLLPTTCCGFL